MNFEKKFLLIAHYHQNGLIRKDLFDLIKISNNYFEEIILISTKLTKSEREKLPKFIKIIIRPNYGYDFFSYKVGMNYLYKKYNKNLEKKTIVCMASSLFYVRPKRLLDKIKSNKIKDNYFYSLTKSWEIQEHLQLDIFLFNMELFKNRFFLNWWKNIKKFKSRHIIIKKYELGLTLFLKKLAINMKTLFEKNINDYPFTFRKMMLRKLINIFYKRSKIYKKNPTHFYWEEIYNEFGILKIDLIKSNPHKVNIGKLKDYFTKKELNKLNQEAINN
jgi:lipopolysaccharide biosynthesis protein